MTELELLRDKVEKLESALGLRVALPDVFGLTPLKEKMVGLLMRREIVSRDMFLDAIYAGKADEPDAQTINVHLTVIKKKLAAHGIAIKNRYGAGWYISAEDKAKFEAVQSTKSEAA